MAALNQEFSSLRHDFYKEFVKFKKSDVFKSLTPEEKGVIEKEAKKTYEAISNAEKAATPATAQEIRNKRGIVKNAIADTFSGILNTGKAGVSLGAWGSDIAGFPDAAKSLDKAAQHIGNQSAKISPSADPDNLVDFGSQALFQNVPMLATSVGLGSVMAGSTKLGAILNNARNAVGIPSAAGLAPLTDAAASFLSTTGVYGIPAIRQANVEAGPNGIREGNPYFELAAAIPYGLIENSLGVTPLKTMRAFGGGKGASKGVMNALRSNAGKIAKVLQKPVFELSKKAGKKGTAGAVARFIGENILGESTEEVLQGIEEIATPHFAKKPPLEAIKATITDLGKPEVYKDLETQALAGGLVGGVLGGGNVAARRMTSQALKADVDSEISDLAVEINDSKASVPEKQALAVVKSRAEILREQLEAGRQEPYGSEPITDATADTFQVEAERTSTPQEVLFDPTTEGSMDDYHLYQLEKDIQKATPIQLFNLMVQTRNLEETNPQKQIVANELKRRGLTPPENIVFPEGEVGQQLRELERAEGEPQKHKIFEYDPAKEAALKAPLLGFDGKAVLPDGSIVKDSRNNKDFITLKSGKPFKTQKAVKAYQTKNKLKESHEVTPVRGGFVLMKKAAEQRPTRIQSELPKPSGDIEIVERRSVKKQGVTRLTGKEGDASRIEKRLTQDANENLRKDSQLNTIEQLSERIKSIEAQRERLIEKSVRTSNAEATSKIDKQIAKLTKRQDALWNKRAKLIKESRAIEQKPNLSPTGEESLQVEKPNVKSESGNKQTNKQPEPTYDYKKDPVVASAFRGKGDKVYVGEVHADAFNKMLDAGVVENYTELEKNFVSGFITDSGRFITKKQALDSIGLDEANAIAGKQYNEKFPEFAEYIVAPFQGGYRVLDPKGKQYSWHSKKEAAEDKANELNSTVSKTEKVEGLYQKSGDFGPVFEEYRGKPKEAVKALLEAKTGEVPGALYHKDVGEIDLVYGKPGTGKSNGYGLAKIAKFHPEVLNNLHNILFNMKISSKSENRIKLESDDHFASVRLAWDGRSKKWLLTAFAKDKSPSGKTTNTSRTQKGRRGDTALSPQASTKNITTDQVEVKKGKRPGLKITSENAALLQNAAKLRKSGNSLLKKAQEKMNQDRQTNTARRARMAAGAEADAAAKEAFAKTMLNIADAMEKGEVKYLSNVKSRPDLEVFIDELRDTKNNHRRKNDLPYGKDFEATENIIRENVVFERPKPYGEWFRMAADDLKDLPGMKIAAKFLEKIGNENRERNLYLSDEQIDRILKIKANLGKKKIKVPYQLERILDSIKHFQKLKKAGINSDSDLADALIEYKNLSEGKRKADPIKEAERAIVGKKYDGMDFFPTPPKLAEKMVKELEIKPGMNVLEPSAGKGDLADAVRNSHPEANIEVIEPVGDLRNILKAKGHTIIDRDFEGFEAEADKSYDRIIMNPPFSKNRDVKHVKKAYDLLKPGGKLVAITGNHWTFANDKESQNFRDWLDKVEGESEELGQAFTGKDAFRQTGVNSQLVTIEKPARTEKPLYSVEYLVARYTAKGLKKAGSIVKRGFELIRSGVKNFAQWARQMFNQFGQPVKKHLRSLWKDLQVANKKLGKRGAIQLPSGKKPLRDSNVPASDTTGQSDMAEKIDKLVKKFNDPTVVSDVTINAEITLDEAKQKLIGLSGKRLINFDTGVEAKINSTQRNKLISLTALEKSQKNGFDAKQHNAAAASIDRLWKHAVLLENGPDKAGDANISSVKRFAAPVLFGDAQAAAYMTAKESIEHGHRVYSLELTEIKMLQHKGGTPFGDTTAGASSTKNDTLSGQKVKPMKNPRRGAIQLPSGKKPLRDSNVPASDRAFELLGIPKNRVVADYDFLLKRHPEYFKSQEEAKSVVEEVLKSPDFATEEKGQLKGLIKKVEGKRYFKNPKVKIDIVKKPDGYHVRSVHLLSDKQYTRDKEKSLTATVKRVAPENLANVFTTKSGLDSPVLTSDSSTKNNTHSGQKVKPMKNPRRGSISEVPIRKSTQEIIELPVELPDGLKTDSISAIRDWLKEKFQGKSVFNESLNAEIEFVGKGLKETVIQLAYRKNRKEKIETHKHSLPILDKLVEQAVYENSVDDKNKGIKKNFADKIHYLSTNVKFDGENYRVKLVVKQYGEKNNYHTHTLSDIEIKKESYAQKDGLRDYQKASAPFSDSSTKNDTLSGQKVKPLESSEKEAIAKFSRLIQSKNLQWKKINHKRAELELLIPGGSVETVATITKNPKGHWEWAGTNRHFLTIGTARKTIKSTIFESLKRSQQQASIRQRKQQQREKIKQLREERQKQRQFKKQQKADRFLSEQGRKEKSQQAIKEKKEPKDLNAKMESYKDKLIKFWADSKRPLQKLQREIEAMANKKLPDWQNAYERFANVKGRIENRQKAFEKKYLEPLKDYMAENGITYNDFNDFVYAMHAPERNAYIQSINPEFRLKGIAGSGMSDQEAEATLKALSKKHGFEKLMKAGRMYWNMHSKLLDMQVKYDLLDKDLKEIIDNKYKYYTPLKSIPDGGNRLDRRALGRVSKAEHHLAYSEQAIGVTFGRGEYNRVYQAFARMALLNPLPEVYELDIGRVKQFFNENTGEVDYRIDQFTDRENVVHAKFGGQDTGIFINDPDLKSAFKHKKPDEEFGTLLKWAFSLRNYMGLIHTQFSPEFLFRNLPRDVQTAFVNASGSDSLKMAAKITKSVPGAIKTGFQYVRGVKNDNTRLYKEYLEEGGKTGYSEMFQLEDRAAKLEKEISERINNTAWFKTKTATKQIGNLISSANDIFESASRFAGYKVAREAGLSKQKAAYFARNLTVDFNKKGDAGKWLNLAYLFSNAGIQGNYVVIKSLKRLGQTNKGKAAIASMMTFGFMMDMLNKALSDYDDDDEKSYYNKIDDYIKDTHFILMRPGTKGKYFSFPMPYGYNVLPTVGRIGSEMMSGNKTIGQGAGSIANAFVNAFNPIGGDNRGLFASLVPTIAKSYYSLDTNSEWTGRKIKPGKNPFGVDEPESHRYWETTNKTLVDLFSWLNRFTGGNKYESGEIDISPADVQYLLEYYAGGPGKFLRRSLETAEKIYKGQPLETSEMPITRVFSGKTRDYGVYDEFRENVDIMQRVQAAKRNNDLSRLKDWKSKHKIYKRVKHARKEIGKIEKSKLKEDKKKEKILILQKKLNASVRKLKENYYQ